MRRTTENAACLKKGRGLSGLAPLGNHLSHGAEAIVLFCMATAVLVLIATDPSNRRNLLRLDELTSGLGMTVVAATAIAVLGVLLAVLAALFWRTSTGVILAAGFLCAYALMLDGPDIIIESLAPKGSLSWKTSLLFELASPDADGAELYVNGVHLGTLPYETTYEEFSRNVPVWSGEPNEYKRDGVPWHEVSRWRLESGESTSYDLPWDTVRVPAPPTQSHGADDRRYYVRVKLDDRWGYGIGRSKHTSHSDVGRYGTWTATVHLNFLFPDRQQRLKTLLNVARIEDYAPSPEWFAALETYGSDGWITLRELMDDEPRLSELLDGWAAWKYGLDQVADTASAWQVFQRIRKEAEQRKYYLTSDVAGKAVELLVPKLDPHQLVRLANRTIDATRWYSYDSWRMNGRNQFGMSFGPEGLHASREQIFAGWTGSPTGQLSPGGYAVAHAIWILDRMLDANDDTGPNIVEREVVPRFIARNYDDVRLLKLAAFIGGPAIEQYLLRQNWQADPSRLPVEQQMRVGSNKVNGWRYLLANLQSPTGRQFREQHVAALKQMADRVVDRTFAVSLNDYFDFVFFDPGPDSFAMTYWPRFKEAVRDEGNNALSLQYDYLLHMEPLSTVAMYVECWRDYRGDLGVFSQALSVLRNASIPYRKRQQIYTGLVAQVERDMSNVTGRGPNPQRSRPGMLESLRSALVPATDEAMAADILAGLRTGSPGYVPENVANWLAYSAPSHPLIGMLAKASKPSLRLLVMGAIREHPTSANRAILAKLLTDASEQVRQAAQAVAAELEALKATPLEQLSSRPER